MNKKISQSKNNSNMILQIGTGFLITLISSIILMIVGAILLNNETLKETSDIWLSVAVWSISVCMGTIFQTLMFDIKKIVIPCITVLIYIVTLILIKLLLWDTGFSGIGQGITSILVGAIPSIIIIVRKASGKSKRFKYRAG